MTKKLSTESYKGVRDFYPDDMAIQQYIFDIWSQTAESFGYERYDASVLEFAELYKAKGAENEELVNEQTYTFVDRGDREVTLRPEMTPTIARMIARKAKELAFPVRWYSIPNLFRYERAQKGRLREHWQLNCDIFGSDDVAADIEVIALAYQVFQNFGADAKTFKIKLNNRNLLTAILLALAKSAGESLTVVQIHEIIRALDKIEKTPEITNQIIEDVVNQKFSEKFKEFFRSNTDERHKVYESTPEFKHMMQVAEGLLKLGITNIEPDITLARGFDYYTGTIFEFVDTSGENNRSLLGGGRYDNLTEMFGGKSIPGVGFGFGDVTMRDFLETHNLLPHPADLTQPSLVVIPTHKEQYLSAQSVAQALRDSGLSVSVDLSGRKLAKQLKAAEENNITYALVLSDDRVTSSTSYTVKNLASKDTVSGTISELIDQL